MSSAVASGSGGGPPDKPPSSSKKGDSKPTSKIGYKKGKRKMRPNEPVYYCTKCERHGPFGELCCSSEGSTCEGWYYLHNQRTFDSDDEEEEYYDEFQPIAECSACGRLGEYMSSCGCEGGIFMYPHRPSANATS